MDRWSYLAALAVAFLFVPVAISNYGVNTAFLLLLIDAIAAVGLNMLTGFRGQVSLGIGGLIAGTRFFAACLGGVEVGADLVIQKSFLVLFMVIIGGLGAFPGAFPGAPSWC